MKETTKGKIHLQRVLNSPGTFLKTSCLNSRTMWQIRLYSLKVSRSCLQVLQYLQTAELQSKLLLPYLNDKAKSMLLRLDKTKQDMKRSRNFYFVK
jgi:hypothetical protein